MTTTHIGSRLDFERKAFYTPAEISDLLHVHVSTVRDWIHADRLFAYRLSERVYRVPLSALMELLGEHGTMTRRELSADEADRLWDGIAGEHRATPDGA
jgi:excisionase family DNA binding protein